MFNYQINHNQDNALTVDLKKFPLSSKFLNWSKLAQPGDNKTTSPGCAIE